MNSCPDSASLSVAAVTDFREFDENRQAVAPQRHFAKITRQTARCLSRSRI
jgi:hypothetical protein